MGNLASDNVALLVTNRAEFGHGDSGTITRCEHFRVFRVAHQQVGDDITFVVGNGQTLQKIMRHPVGEQDFDFGGDGLTVLEFDAVSRQAHDVAGVVDVVEAHAAGRFQQLSDHFFTGIFGNHLGRGGEGDLSGITHIVFLQPRCHGKGDFDRRAFAGCHRIGDAAAGVRF